MFSPKKLLIATALAAATLSAAGTTWAKDLTIGLAVANLQADFFNQIKQSVEAEGKAKGIKVITVDAQGNSSTQVSQIEDLITRQIDVLIYIPAGATAAGVPVKAAKAAGIPVIAVDRNAPDAPGDTFIASDSVAGAKTLAEYVGKITDGKGRIAILQGQLGTTPEDDRAKGFEEGLKPSRTSRSWPSNPPNGLRTKASPWPRTCSSVIRISPYSSAAPMPWPWALPKR